MRRECDVGCKVSRATRPRSIARQTPRPWRELHDRGANALPRTTPNRKYSVRGRFAADRVRATSIAAAACIAIGALGKHQKKFESLIDGHAMRRAASQPSAAQGVSSRSASRWPIFVGPQARRISCARARPARVQRGSARRPRATPARAGCAEGVRRTARAGRLSAARPRIRAK